MTGPGEEPPPLVEIPKIEWQQEIELLRRAAGLDDHAAAVGMALPTEPILFLKAITLALLYGGASPDGVAVRPMVIRQPPHLPHGRGGHAARPPLFALHDLPPAVAADAAPRRSAFGA